MPTKKFTLDTVTAHQLMKMKFEKGREQPTVTGLIVGRQIVLVCPYCDKEHRHGTGSAKPNTKDREHRLAHCRSKGGYFIKVVA